ncbi:MAG: hypothetical protein JSW47_05910 [Phycisphaerales bacterium]|nr:MAG: hypothetical protein JSW47_05910 [Phycisphaerales bacterium]
MVKRCIGIEVGPSYLCAVQVLRIGRAFCIEKVFDTQARRDTDSASEMLKALVSKHGFDRRAAVAISMPNDAVFFRSLETDAVGLEQVRDLRYSMFDYDFPIEADEIVAQPFSYRQTSDQRYSILTAAVARQSLREARDIVVGARMQPNFIGSTVFSIHSTVSLNHPESRTGIAIIAHVTEYCLNIVVTENNKILIVRHFPIVGNSESNGHPLEDQIGDILCREAGITWRKLFETEIPQDARVYLVGASESTADLKETIEENLHCRAIVANPYARVLLKHVGRHRVDISVAEGLALKTLAPEHIAGINFLEADSIKAKSTTSLKKELTVCALLVVAIAAVSLIGLFMRRSQLEARYEGIKSEINENFQRALPQEKIVNPLAQLDQKLQTLQKDYALFGPALGAGVGPLEVLNVITDSTPEDMNISLDDVLITTESVRLTGTAESFESVYNWQRLLERTSQFADVEVGDPQLAADGKLVHFVVLASFSAKDQG